MHLYTRAHFALSSDADGVKRDRANDKVDGSYADVARGGSWSQQLAGGATDVQLSLPGITGGRVVFLKTEKASGQTTTPTVTLKINSAGASGILVAADPDGEGSFLVTTSGVTSLFVTNNSLTVPVEITWGVID